MSETVTIHAAKTHLSELIARVEAGEEIIIARRDKPVVKLVPVEKPARIQRVPGAMKHLIGEITDDAFAPLTDEELKQWFGEGVFD